MAHIHFIQPDNRRITTEICNGKTVKDAAVRSLVPGILAECGGACMCATCHVHIDDDWLAIVGQPNSEEAYMLEFADNVEERSRLACQIAVTDSLNGLVAYIPP